MPLRSPPNDPAMAPPAPLRWGWLPSVCQVCGTWPARPWGQAVCQDCLHSFVPAVVRCPVCALPLPAPTGTPCPGDHPGEGLDRAVAAVDYGYPWDGLLARFKFQGDTAWAGLFAGLMAQAPGAAGVLADADWVLPVPLTASRLGQRGYHQTWLLAQALARQGWVPRPRLQAQWLTKTHDTATQHTLTRSQRWANLRHAFAVAPTATAPLARRRVLLVDDILTTGATLNAAARALKMVGVAEVSALVLARTHNAWQADQA